MTRDQAITLLLARVGQRQNDTNLTATAVLEMQLAQEELETGGKANLPWFLKQEYTDAAFKTSVSSPLLAVPLGFLREWDEVRVALFYQDAAQDDAWVPVPKVNYDEGKTEFGGETPGAPEAYTLMGQQYRFWPDPDAEYPLKALIYIADTALTSNIENAWLKHAGKLLIGKTGFVVASVHVRDEVAAAAFTLMAAQGADALTRADVAREEAGRSRSQGED
jgi:hypothetical protein